MGWLFDAERRGSREGLALLPRRSGLRETSSIMVDKVATVPRAKPGDRIGRLSDEDVVRLNRALLLFLGLTR